MARGDIPTLQVALPSLDASRRERTTRVKESTFRGHHKEEEAATGQGEK